MAEPSQTNPPVESADTPSNSETRQTQPSTTTAEQAISAPPAQKPFTVRELDDLQAQFNKVKLLEELGKILQHPLRFVLIAVIPEPGKVLLDDQKTFPIFLVGFHGHSNLQQIEGILEAIHYKAHEETQFQLRNKGRIA